MGVVYANFVAIAQPEESGQSMQLNKDGEISLLCGAIYKFTIVSLWLILSVIEGAYRGEGKTTDNDEEITSKCEHVSEK